jgi:hypothetical protein
MSFTSSVLLICEASAGEAPFAAGVVWLVSVDDEGGLVAG